MDICLVIAKEVYDGLSPRSRYKMRDQKFSNFLLQARVRLVDIYTILHTRHSKMELQPAFLESLHGLSKSLDEKVHLLASAGDERLAEIALDVTKQLFDLGTCLSLGLAKMLADANRSRT